MPPGKNLLDSRAPRFFPDLLPKFLYVIDRLIYFLLAALWFRHNPGNPTATPGKDDGFPTLDVIEQAGEMGFGLRGLNFARHRTCPYWSIQSVDLGPPA
jgi:hypothetical protein